MNKFGISLKLIYISDINPFAFILWGVVKSLHSPAGNFIISPFPFT